MPAPRLSRPGQWPGRSSVLGRRGMVCTSHSLASGAALDILRRGGNAIDAAICASATLAAVEPLSTGIGGDMFALYWSAKDKKLKGLNGSGRSPENLSWRTFARRGIPAIPRMGWPSVTMPGCVDGWWQMHQADGKLPWSYLFGAAIEYAREGVALSEIVAGGFENLAPRLQSDYSRAIFLPEGKIPKWGQVWQQPDLAKSLELISSGGRDAFYRGEIADKILKSSEAGGGFFTKADFETHASLWQQPIKTTFRSVDIYELPPNTQGATVILALNILSSLGLDKLSDDWVGLTHSMIEALKLAFAERNAHIADPREQVPLEKILSLTFATHLGLSVDKDHAIPRRESLSATAGDTVYLATADEDGNMVSFISSLYEGSGVVADGTGIHLQNRAATFTLEDNHPNRLEPKKRPLHTLIPGFAMRHDKPYMAFGVMGGHHQAQGQVQFLSNLLLHGMSLQESLSAPRFDFRAENYVAYEMDLPGELREALAARGHVAVENDAGPFGGAQALRVVGAGVYEGASDPRKDGCAIGY